MNTIISLLLTAAILFVLWLYIILIIKTKGNLLGDSKSKNKSETVCKYRVRIPGSNAKLYAENMNKWLTQNVKGKQLIVYGEEKNEKYVDFKFSDLEEAKNFKRHWG